MVRLLAVLLILGLGWLTYFEGPQGSLARNNVVVIPPLNYRPAPESADSNAGKALVQKHNCQVCHSISGTGGCLGPPWDGIGAHRNREFVQARITNDAAAKREFARLYPHEELMEHPRVPAREAALIASYLLTLPQPAQGFRVAKHSITAKAAVKQPEKSMPAEPSAKTISTGRALFFDKGCAACHSIGLIGGHFAPRLDGIGKRHDRQYIVDRMTIAETLNSQSTDETPEKGILMPPSGLTAQEISQIADFLKSLP